LITMRCSTLRGTFCSLITLATPRQDWTGSNPSRREGGDCGFILSMSHSCCAVRLVYIQISPGHIWTTLYLVNKANLVHNFYWYVYFCSLHVSGNYVPIIWYAGWIKSTLHTRQSSKQSDKYQVAHRYSCFSWWWAHSRLKHVQKKTY